MHTRLALLLLAFTLRVALLAVDGVPVAADTTDRALFCPPLCRLLGWGAQQTSLALPVGVPARLFALVGDALFAFAVNEFCFVAYAHNQLRRDVVFGVVFNTPLLLVAGHLQQRPHCAMLAALVLMAMTRFWRGNIYRAWFLYACLVALDGSFLYLAPLFAVFFVRCALAGAGNNKRACCWALWRPLLFAVLTVLAMGTEAALVCRRLLERGQAPAAVLRAWLGSLSTTHAAALALFAALQAVWSPHPVRTTGTDTQHIACGGGLQTVDGKGPVAQLLACRAHNTHGAGVAALVRMPRVLVEP